MKEICFNCIFRRFLGIWGFIYLAYLVLDIAIQTGRLELETARGKLSFRSCKAIRPRVSEVVVGRRQRLSDGRVWCMVSYYEYVLALAGLNEDDK